MSRVRDLLAALETASGVQTDAVEGGSVPAPARVRLANFAPVSQTNAHGKAAFLFGLVFAAFGALPLLAALDVIHSPDSSFHAPRWFVGGVAALFFVLPGLSLVVHGLRGLVRERRRREMLAMHPDQPWRGDHPWHPDGETRSGWRAVRQRAVQIVAFPCSSRRSTGSASARKARACFSRSWPCSTCW